MSTALGLFVLLMLGGLGGAASQVQIYGKSVYGGMKSGYVGRPGSGGHLTRTPSKNTIHRSLDLEAFNLHVTPTSSRISLPTVIRLYPPTAKPLHLHANMPLRFGRANGPAHDGSTNPNMPLRFGRNSDPARHQPANPNMPLRFGRDSDADPDATDPDRDPTAPRRGSCGRAIPRRETPPRCPRGSAGRV
ncbi:pro-FMRFamide-related neuropeptide VF [Boleophthalmus pectinirostris]|uniref:pro-FMRFamide-related neuropeptide VF n=1 Tax=Boleophthalmus pectinirostris TaxID=150288 RepID=UPI002430E533|nr:pro-FMRFamide-related neuropeptide VF [Boleophthalmus pectinirostris]